MFMCNRIEPNKINKEGVIKTAFVLRNNKVVIIKVTKELSTQGALESWWLDTINKGEK